MQNKHTKVGITTTNQIMGVSSQFNTASPVPIYTIDGDRSVHLPDFIGVKNDQSGQVVQVASDHYQIIQHRDVLNAIGEVLMERGINVYGNIHNFGDMFRADLVFATGTGTKVRDDAKGVYLGFRAINSYNRSTAFRLEMYGFRAICSNGMALGKALHNIREVTFHMGAEKNYAHIREITSTFIDTVIASSKKLQELVDDSISDTIVWDRVGPILEKYLKHNKHRETILKLLGIATIDVYDKKTKVRKFTYVLDDQKVKKMTRWDIYNALTNYASHNELGLSVENTVQEVAQKILSTPVIELAPVAN